jgi:hypothetical protein
MTRHIHVLPDLGCDFLLMHSNILAIFQQFTVGVYRPGLRSVLLKLINTDALVTIDYC